MTTDPTGPPMLYYVKRGIARWERYLQHYHHELPELLRSHCSRAREHTRSGSAVPAKRSTKNPQPYDYQRKRKESAEAHAKLAKWLLVNHDKRTRWVGIWSHGVQRPARIEEICTGAGINEEQLKGALRRFRRNRWIHRWQGRDFRPENKDQPFAGKVATLRLTLAFFQVSHVAGLRKQLLDKEDSRKEKAERRERELLPVAQLAAELVDGPPAPLSTLEKIRRRVLADMPDASPFARDQEFDRRLTEWRECRPPPPK